MQICLLDESLSKDDAATLTRDSCELQITSMLAHVWNEIEHDTIYKTKTGHLSDEERRAIHSLGLLTQTGDHIIQGLLSSRDIREKKEELSTKKGTEIFADETVLSLFVVNHFGEKVGSDKMDFTEGNVDLLALLHEINWDHPNDIKTNFSPQILREARTIGNRISKHQVKAGRKNSLYRPKTCDIFIVALCIIDLPEVKRVFEALNPKSRAFVIWNTFKQLRGGPSNSTSLQPS